MVLEMVSKSKRNHKKNQSVNYRSNKVWMILWTEDQQVEKSVLMNIWWNRMLEWKNGHAWQGGWTKPRKQILLPKYLIWPYPVRFLVILKYLVVFLGIGCQEISLSPWVFIVILDIVCGCHLNIFIMDLGPWICLLLQIFFKKIFFTCC